MTRENARAAVKDGNLLTLAKARTLKSGNLLTWAKARFLKTANRLTLVFISGTLLVFASVIRMGSHWLEISASLGFHKAAGVLAAVTGAALFLAWWLNTDNQ